MMKVPAWLFGLSVLLSLGAVVAAVSVVREVRQLRQDVAQLKKERPGTTVVVRSEKETTAVPHSDPVPVKHPEPVKKKEEAAPSADIDKKVRASLEALRKEEQEAAWEKKAKWIADARERRIAKAAEQLALSSYQQSELLKIVTHLEDAARELWIEAKSSENPDFGAVKEQVGVLRQESNTRIQHLLSPVQYEEWVRMEQERRHRGGKD